ncbi:SWIM zinc finger family protein [Amycolatopsis sp. BJA-103]|uniref:SWIM zinc finger family protein n=1 Tax=Amycolatopsis sp. BJA-103 TaxID=1911175 RepID=UPI001F37C710|nr:SWIM zinc finger family protein [Amycolatopsis sp. BJA-103]
MSTPDDRVRGFPAFGAQGGHGQFARSWWGRAWINAMEDTALDLRQLKQGRKYAAEGRVGPITVSPGRIGAVVDDQEGQYRTEVRLAELTDTEWDRFLDRVASRAGHLAALLDRDMPHDLVEAADDAGVHLLPGIGDLDPDCDCPGWELPCRHAAALSFQASWLLDADPFVLLLMRGKGSGSSSTNCSGVTRLGSCAPGTTTHLRSGPTPTSPARCRTSPGSRPPEDRPCPGRPASPRRPSPCWPPTRARRRARS